MQEEIKRSAVIYLVPQNDGTVIYLMRTEDGSKIQISTDDALKLLAIEETLVKVAVYDPQNKGRLWESDWADMHLTIEHK